LRRQLQLRQCLSNPSDSTSSHLQTISTELNTQRRMNNWINVTCWVLPRDVLHMRGLCRGKCQSICLSVRLSVTRRCCVKTAKCITKLFKPSGSRTIPVFPYKTSRKRYKTRETDSNAAVADDSSDL